MKFFTQNYESFKIDQWYIKYESPNIFIYHPDWKFDSNMSFWITQHNYSISLPISLDNELYSKLQLQLSALLPSLLWACDNNVETVLKLPKEKKLLRDVLDIIFDAYKLPDQAINLVKKKLDIPLSPNAQYVESGAFYIR